MIYVCMYVCMYDPLFHLRCIQVICRGRLVPAEGSPPYTDQLG